ncbi:MAG: HAD family hydrolase, partial [Chloroflexi bacterium]|nr:HAD family hydrolase [Chloroflexota bacterium]
HCFDAIAISGEIGAVKPDPAIFEVALSGLGVPGDDVWHVGDSPGIDVAGARAAGLKAVWINRSGRRLGEGEPEPHMEIRSLAELAPLLGGSPAP